MITMPPEYRETMQKPHDASVRLFQGNNSFNSPRYYNGLTMEPKNTNSCKQANSGSETKGAVSTEKLAVTSECCGLQQGNYYSWPGFSPNYLGEFHSHSNPFDGGFYHANHWQWQGFPGTWVAPQVPLPILCQGQGYQHEYTLQEFQYFVVIDFEATCDKERKPHPQEIIEFPSVIVNSMTGQLEDCFQQYVRPTCNKELTEFCKELTGIHQSQVDEGVPLTEALLLHDKWLEDKGIKHANFAVVTWSSWDCRVILESECRFKKIKKPEYFNKWINLKIPFCEVFGGVRCNLKEAVKLAGLTWEGRAHCGLDDAKNTAHLLANIMHRGFKFSITNSLLGQSTDPPPYVTAQQTPSQPEHSVAAAFVPPSVWKNYPQSPYFHSPIPYPPIADPSINDTQVRCYCGATSIKFKQPSGHKHGSLFFGCGNWTANRGALCSFSVWATEHENLGQAG